MTHSPADIISRIIIAGGLGSDPPGTSWPVNVGKEADTPDEVMTIYNTEGMDHGRSGVDSRRVQHFGIQVRVRSRYQANGYSKSGQVADFLDEDVYQTGVTIDSSSYLVHSFNRTSQVLSFDKETPTSKRSIHTFNGLVAIRQVS